jgi:hypothetical protein
MNKPDLETLIKRRQDELRGRPENWWAQWKWRWWPDITLAELFLLLAGAAFFISAILQIVVMLEAGHGGGIQ